MKPYLLIFQTLIRSHIGMLVVFILNALLYAVVFCLDAFYFFNYVYAYLNVSSYAVLKVMVMLTVGISFSFIIFE